ncbi:MAG: hypothetical protein ACKOEC_17780, partial [Acidimicrobiia bacterium]
MAQCGGGSPTAPQSIVIEPTPVAVTPVTTTPSTTEAEVAVPARPPVTPAPGTTSTFGTIRGDTGWCGSP